MNTCDIHMGDPFIYTHNNTYYLIGTTDGDEGFRAYKSEDLENWEDVGFILHKEKTGFGKTSFWAPEMFIDKGKFYLTYSANDTFTDKYGIGYLFSEHPLKGWEKLSKTPWFTSSKTIFSPGHNSIFKDLKGNLKIVFHSLKEKGSYDRIVNIKKLSVRGNRLYVED